MKKLKFLGKTYNGYNDSGRELYAATGDVVPVGDAKAAQLLKDFPGEWEEITEENDPSRRGAHINASTDVVESEGGAGISERDKEVERLAKEREGNEKAGEVEEGETPRRRRTSRK